LSMPENMDQLTSLFMAPFAVAGDEDIPEDTGQFSTVRNSGHSSLPNSNEELKAMAKYTENGEYYLGKQATEGHFKKLSKQNQYDVIHISTHGILNSNPLYSNLDFNSSLSIGDEDNKLHVYELYNLPLSARLVVLSACSTGEGQYTPGEGVMSIGRAFMYAGSPSIVMSLWEVNDRSTSHLMEYFYKALNEGYTKDRALQKAKLQYLETICNWATHPFYWSAFVTMGNSQAIH